MAVGIHSSPVPAPGQIARVRQRLYVVDEIISPIKDGDSTLVRLSCLDDDNQGRPLEVLWERELDAETIGAEDWDSIAKRGFDKARVFAAFFNTLRWNCVTATDPKLFQAPFRAGIRLDAYQLEPLRKALLLPRVNLFIADDVGLGKTIEAGLIARELLLRKKVQDIVVSCPPSMLLQWKDELETRFGLTFEIVDKDYMSRVRRQRGFGVNPWTTHSRFLISHRLLIDEAYVGPLRDWLGPLKNGTLLILDEAHNAAPATGQKYAVDSQFTKAVRDLAPRFEHRLFLSATPHNGHSNSFSALLEILDPQRFCRGVPVSSKALDTVIVRRLKEDLRNVVGGLPKRIVKELIIDGLPNDSAELRLATLLEQYRILRENRLKDKSKQTQTAAGLLITGLQQRLLSSIEAFARTLRVHRRTMKRQREAQKLYELERSGNLRVAEPVTTYEASTQPILNLNFSTTNSDDTSMRQVEVQSTLNLDLISEGVSNDDERANLPEEELLSEEEAQIEVAYATASSGSFAPPQILLADEERLLDEMTSTAESARGKPDARVRSLIEWIKQTMCEKLGERGALWNDTRVIIFTEYDDTRRYLQQQIEAVIEESDRASERILVYFGQTTSSEREEIKYAFNAEPSKHPVRILIATDAAREGLNLQAHCCNLFHFDIPWNPSRMEQRNGRIDRKLQPHDKVFCHYFVHAQRPEDKILSALVRKTETIKKELGSLSQVIDAKLHKRLEHGIKRSSITDLEKDISEANLRSEQLEVVETELESSRLRQDALRTEIAKLELQLAESRKSIGLTKEHFASAISCALEMMGAPALCRIDNKFDGLEQFQFPLLEQRDGADPTWVNTIDTLRTPRKREEKPWEWRRVAAVRPIVFDEPQTMTDDVVHLHLEHRVVQRLLSWFSCQGFTHHELSRACLSQTHDSIPRVILLGRLCLYGAGAARLHEELVPITARWVEPAERKAPLVPYARDTEVKTLGMLEDALSNRVDAEVPHEVIDQLRYSAKQDISELLEHLAKRGDEHAKEAQDKLAKRCDAEIKAMLEILQTQKKHISSMIAKYEKEGPIQLRLQFTMEEEARQVEANKRYWDKRLGMIEKELQTEPERIERVYEVKVKRIEPVGLVYLWPTSGAK